MALAVLFLYGLALLLLFLYNCGQLSLIISYLKSRKNRHKATRIHIPVSELPRVTVQLPVYNELYVVERLIDAVAQLNYPADKLDIQVLDDSTDETVSIIANRIAHYQQLGVPIEHVRRPERTGFKADRKSVGRERVSIAV